VSRWRRARMRERSSRCAGRLVSVRAKERIGALAGRTSQEEREVAENRVRCAAFGALIGSEAERFIVSARQAAAAQASRLLCQVRVRR